MSEGHTTPIEPRPVDTTVPRQVSRLVHPELHVSGSHLTNFKADAEAMLMDGEYFGLDERDLSTLAFFYRFAKRQERRSDEQEVFLSGRQWGQFVGIRRKFLKAMRDPAYLINSLRAERQTNPLITDNETP